MDKCKKFFSPRAAILFLLVLGVFLRVTEYLDNRSLWYDEARVANQLIDLDIGRMFDPSRTNLGYPLGFLCIEKLLITALGHTEPVLRIFPLLFGIAALVLFPWLVKKSPLTKAGQIIAVFIFAVSFELIYFSAEAKPYTLDVVISILLLGFFFDVYKKPFQKISVAKSALLACLILLFSYRAAFVVFGAGLPLLAYFFFKKDTEKYKPLLTLNLILTGVFVSYYLFAIRPFMTVHNLTDWEEVYSFTPPVLSLEFVRWLIVDMPFHLVFGLKFQKVLASLFLVVGIVDVWKKGAVPALILSGPIALTVVASCFHYPLYDRLILFLHPGLIILITAGVFRVCSAQNTKMKILLISACLFFLMKDGIYYTYQQFSSPWAQQEIKPVLDYIRKGKKPGDKIFVDYTAKDAFIYYSRFYTFNPDELLPQNMLGPDVTRGMPGGQRVWFLFFAGNRSTEMDIEKLGGKKLDTFKVVPLKNSTQYWSVAETLLVEF